MFQPLSLRLLEIFRGINCDRVRILKHAFTGFIGHLGATETICKYANIYHQVDVGNISAYLHHQ